MFSSYLEFAGGPSSSAYRRRIVRRGHSYDVADAHLNLQIGIARTMIMREEHENMMRNHILIISVA